jgi:hypothetical protein
MRFYNQKTKKCLPLKYFPDYELKFIKKHYETFKGRHGIEYVVITGCTGQCPFHCVEPKEDYPYCGITLDDVYDEVHFNVVGENCPLNDAKDIKIISSLNTNMEK